MNESLKKIMEQYGDFTEEQMEKIAADVPIRTFKKGTILLEQGDTPTQCFHVLKGLIRKYGIDEMGREITYNFYTENQTVALFNQHNIQIPSKYSFECTEDCELIVGELSTEQQMYETHEGLQEMNYQIMEVIMGDMQEEHSIFMASSPEERYQMLMEKRPELIGRVPQHQLASYLGITPESLSRIKRRIQRAKLKIVD